MSLIQRHVEVYEFQRGPRFLRVTSGDRPVEISGVPYQAAPGLKRGRLAQSGSEAANELGIDVPRAFPLLDWLVPFIPTEPIQVRLLRVRVSDGQTRRLWSGRLADVKKSTSTVNLRCANLLASMSTNGLRRCWQTGCPFALYGLDCGVDQEDHRVNTTLTDSTGYVVTAAAFGTYDDGWFAGGFLRWSDGLNTEHRFVVSHTGTDLTLLTPAPPGAGLAVAAFPGCGHSIEICDEKFNNAENYGGQHTMPKGKHPFDGTPAF